MNHKFRVGFTLIELLIVVAIIAILAAIAVPNFLEAQTRAKVSRVKADMRSLATAIETYRIDWNIYPIASQWVNGSNDRPLPDNFNNRLHGVTTPQAYITSLPQDVFWVKTLASPVTAGTLPTFEYGDRTTYVNGENLGSLPSWGLFADRAAWYEYEGHGLTVIEWILHSSGPDQRNDFQSIPLPIMAPAIELGFNQTYDPTNGTISRGDIVRTNAEQKN